LLSARGQKLVRALARRPEVLLVDEPVGGLEDAEVSELLETLLALQGAEGWGLLVVEHDLRFVAAVAEHLLVMEDGRLLAEGPTKDVLAEESVRRIYLGEITTA
jgi:branched-chain amino acid transport system ATP-binding protein